MKKFVKKILKKAEIDIDKLYSFVRRKLIDIDKEPIPDDQKISQTILFFSAICAAVAVQPIPFADIFVLTPLQAYMGTRIAKIRNYELSFDTIYREIILVLGLGYLAQQTAIGLYKTVIPFLGGFTTIPLVFILTYAIGQVMDFYVKAKKDKRVIDKEELKNTFKNFREDSKAKFSKKEIRDFVNKIKEEYKNHSYKPEKFVKENIDELVILAVIRKIQNNELLLSEADNVILASAIRYTNNITDLDSARDFFQGRSHEQLIGDSNQLLGIAHEIKYTIKENENGDSVFAFMPDDTSYPQWDVFLVDVETGFKENVQLKIGDQATHIYDWIEKYPGNDDKLRVSEELARELNLPSSGVSNTETTIEVEKFIDKLIADEDQIIKVLTITPSLTIIAMSLILYRLYKRLSKNEINQKQFITMATKMTGLKAGKILTILTLLSMPVIGQVTGVYLISKIILSALDIFDISKEKLLLTFKKNN